MKEQLRGKRLPRSEPNRSKSMQQSVKKNNPSSPRRRRFSATVGVDVCEGHFWIPGDGRNSKPAAATAITTTINGNRGSHRAERLRTGKGGGSLCCAKLLQHERKAHAARAGKQPGIADGTACVTAKTTFPPTTTPTTTTTTHHCCTTTHR